MNPTEACRYMADPDNWCGVEMFIPHAGWETARFNDRQRSPTAAMELAASALSDTAETIPTRRVVVRQQDKPCVVCRRKIEPGQAYVVDGPKHVLCAGPRR